MGAEQFFDIGYAEDAKKAFDELVHQAQYDYGHSGYTGTIGEKTNFVKIPLPPDTDPMTYANQLIDQQDDRVDDKWGPAGCIEMTPTEKDKTTYGQKVRKFLFFGWASS